MRAEKSVVETSDTERMFKVTLKARVEIDTSSRMPVINNIHGATWAKRGYR